ncbi:MAG: hypothetical protein RL220_871 [Bacteroidota bacterium]
MVTHREKEVILAGSLPEVGTPAPDFRLTLQNLSDVSLADFKGRKLVLNIFPSIDTPTCASSVRRFNALMSDVAETVVICVSKDLPFAQRRFCGAEGIENVITGSQYKDTSFSDAYGVDMVSGTALSSLMSRAVVVIDRQGIVRYTEQVGDISIEPDYEKVLNALSEVD